MKTYSFLDLTLLINGVSITGFDEGDDVIILDRTVNSANHKIGTDGEMSTSISADRSGSVVFKLMQTSSSNLYLSGLIGIQETGNGATVSVMFKDTRGRDLGVGTQGYIPKPAKMTRGTNVNNQEWMIVVENLELLFVGDNG